MIAYRRAETLSREDEAALIEAAQDGDVAARNRLVLAHLPFVRWWAARQRRVDWMTYDDVVSVGVLGMIRAIAKYDATKNVRLTHYAKTWMLERLTVAVNANSLVRVPRSAIQALRRGKLKERTARAVVFALGGMRVLPPQAFEEMSRRWWAERWPQEFILEE